MKVCNMQKTLLALHSLQTKFSYSLCIDFYWRSFSIQHCISTKYCWGKEDQISRFYKIALPNLNLLCICFKVSEIDMTGFKCAESNGYLVLQMYCMCLTQLMCTCAIHLASCSRCANYTYYSNWGSGCVETLYKCLECSHLFRTKFLSRKG